MVCLDKPCMLSLRHRRTFLTAFLGAAWGLSLFLGWRSLLSYESTPGSASSAVSAWPSDSKIARAADRPTLIMLAHPHCPCTRASVEELAKIMAQTSRKPAAYVLFLKPEGSASDWDDTALRKLAASIPGVTVVTDDGGSEARRFGAETSGHTLLFDPAGTRLFSGGITSSRGHAGDNAGEDAIVSLVSQNRTNRPSTLVFGCALNNPTEDSK